MRVMTIAALGLAVALPVSVATVPAHADTDWLNRAQNFLQGNQDQRDNRDYRDHGDQARHERDWNQSYGDNRYHGDRGDRQYGENGYDHHAYSRDGDRSRRFNDDRNEGRYDNGDRGD